MATKKKKIKKLTIIEDRKNSPFPFWSSLALALGISIVLVPIVHRSLYLLDRDIVQIEAVGERFVNFLYKSYDSNYSRPEVPRIATEYEDKLYSVDMFRDAGVMFPEVHFIIHFKETSFCRPMDGGIATLCTDDLEEVLGFNPYNGSGMKHPAYRKTYSMGSIGSVLKSMDRKLPAKYAYYYKDPHATYANPFHHCLDIALWQEYWMSRKYYPKTEADYIAFLQKVGYNPYDNYYNDPKKGLKVLLKQYYDGTFKVKYNKYLKERMYYEI